MCEEGRVCACVSHTRASVGPCLLKKDVAGPSRWEVRVRSAGERGRDRVNGWIYRSRRAPVNETIIWLSHSSVGPGKPTGPGIGEGLS